MGKILDYKSMTTMQKIIFYVIILFIVIILGWILRVLNVNRQLERTAIINNYNDVKDYTYFIFQGTTTNDRQLYWDLNDIIVGYIEASKYESDNLEFSTNNYFSALTDEYQNFLGKSKYEDISKQFVEKFAVGTVQEVNYKTQDIIENIYDLQNDMYFCELHGTNDKIAYIGIKLEKGNKTYQIFYIE